jgi:hypothetical protein
VFRSPTWSAISLILSAVSLTFAQSPTVVNCSVFTANNIWNTPVDQLSVSPSSSAWVTTIGPTKPVHADFGSGLYQGAPIGIPYITVPGTQQKYPVTFTYADESDPGPYAIPLSAPIEGGAQSTGDRHTLSVDTDNCILYELYSAYPQAAAPGGNSTVGLVSTTGLYTAPAAPPSGGTVTVQAASTVSPSAIGSAIVTVTAPPVAPTLSSIAPNSGTQGTSVHVTLAGSNFRSGATVAVTGSGVSVTGITVVSSTQITATFVVAATAATGARSVTVTTAGGTSAPQSFTVNGAPAKPTLTSLSPNSAARGATVNVTLIGTNFTAPATIAVEGGATSVSNVVVVNSTKITATLHVSSSATRRSRNTSVTTPAGTSNALPFTIR